MAKTSSPTRVAFILLAITIAIGPVTPQRCPGRCNSCENSVVDCRNRRLTSPPKFFPPGTRTIDLHGNYLRVIGSRSFRGNQSTEVLKLAKNKVVLLRQDAFASFPNLMLLDLQGNKIARIYNRAFRRMSRLRILKLNRNKIRKINRIFTGTPNLHQLNLANNRLTSIEENELAPLQDLRNLDLRSNSIARIHRRAFKQLESLRYLFLANNPIAQALDLQFSSTVLQLVDMSNCQMPSVPQTLPSSVSDLRLGNNKIMHINHTDFQNITDLQMIALDDNELHFLADGTFSHLTELKEIWLRGNNLVYVPRDIPPNVDKLYIDSNRIQEIEPGLFSSDSVLSFFNAENNQINRINPQTFAGMVNLITINLQGNQIHTLEEGTFANLENLHTVLLSNNPLHRIEANVFQNLPRLTYLHVSYLSPDNTQIEGNFLPAMPQLNTLQVMASPGMGQAIADMIQRYPGEVTLPVVSTVDLSYNSLQWISPKFRIIFPNVRSVLLDGNPFHCSERLSWLQDWITSTSIRFFNYEDPKCHTPRSLVGRDVKSLTQDEWINGGSRRGAVEDLSTARLRQKRRHRDRDSMKKQGADDKKESTLTRKSNEDETEKKTGTEEVRGPQRETTLNSKTNTKEISQTKEKTVMRSMKLRAEREERRMKLRKRYRKRSRKNGRRGRKRRGRKGKGKKNRKRKGKKNKKGKKRGNDNDEKKTAG